MRLLWIRSPSRKRRTCQSVPIVPADSESASALALFRHASIPRTNYAENAVDLPQLSLAHCTPINTATVTSSINRYAFYRYFLSGPLLIARKLLLPSQYLLPCSHELATLPLSIRLSPKSSPMASTRNQRRSWASTAPS